MDIRELEEAGVTDNRIRSCFLMFFCWDVFMARPLSNSRPYDRAVL